MTNLILMWAVTAALPASAQGVAPFTVETGVRETASTETAGSLLRRTLAGERARNNRHFEEATLRIDGGLGLSPAWEAPAPRPGPSPAQTTPMTRRTASARPRLKALASLSQVTEASEGQEGFSRLGFRPDRARSLGWFGDRRQTQDRQAPAAHPADFLGGILAALPAQAAAGQTVPQAFGSKPSKCWCRSGCSRAVADEYLRDHGAQVKAYEAQNGPVPAEFQASALAGRMRVNE